MRLSARRRNELLSAYLDNQLDAEERVRLEAHLATDSALRTELEALRHTVALLHEMPPVPLPRNFILPRTAEARPHPAPLARPRFPWAAPLLTAATAVVSLLFAVVLAGDLLLATSGRLGFAPLPEADMLEAPQVAMESVVVEEAVEVEKEAPVATEPVAAEAPAAPPPASRVEEEAEEYAAEAPEEPVAGEMTPEGDPVAEGEVVAEAELAPEDASEVSGGEGALATAPVAKLAADEEVPTAVPTDTVGTVEGADATAAPAATPTAQPQPSPEAREESVTTGVTVTTVAEAPALQEMDEGIQTEDEDRRILGLGTPRAPAPWWRASEVVLGVLVLALALVTIWAWRIRRR